jgi:hypothetical protein
MNPLEQENQRLCEEVAMLEGQLRSKACTSDLGKVTRFEVIGKNGRQMVEHGIALEASLQDDDRTLKIFLKER